MEILLQVHDRINGLVWGPALLSALLGIGVLLSVRTRWFQIRHARLWLLGTLRRMIRPAERKEGQGISQFQALCAALAGTVGTGNIAGVASAIALGGPGAVFWMWVSALLGMMTGFAEKALGIKYRYRDAQGRWVGGAMVYIERGLGSRPLALAYAVLCALASFGIGNMTQSNSIASVLQEGFGVPTVLSGLLCALLVAVVVVGGIRRLAQVAEMLVPMMVFLYMGGALWCLIARLDLLPWALGQIFSEAFRPQSALGGAAGYSLARAMRMGVSRGLFSNEAGMGSSVMVHAQAEVDEPAEQGLWGTFEVFMDTIVMCTLTALVILTSGAYDAGAYSAALSSGAPVPQGAALTTGAMGVTLGRWAAPFVALSVTLFAFATIISWSYYGEKSATYALGPRAAPLYRLLAVAATYLGAVSQLTLIWDISDTLNGLMAIPNLIALFVLSGQVVSLLGIYLDKQVLH